MAKSLASYGVNYTAWCLLVRGDGGILMTTQALVDVWQASETNQNNGSLVDF